METRTTLSRKERERLARREEILAAAKKVFSERGFEKATLDEIAEVAEFGKGTIYNYFSSKEELFASIIERGIDSFQRFVSERITNKISPKEKVATYVDAAFDFFQQHRQLFSILVLERHKLERVDNEWFNRCCQQQSEQIAFLNSLIKEGIQIGEFKNLPADKLAQFLTGMIHVSIFHAIRNPQSVNLKKDAKIIKELFFEGVALIDSNGLQ